MADAIPTRLSPKLTVLAVFAAFGIVVGTHIGALPFLVARSDVPPVMFGMAGSAAMLANIGVMGFGGFINRRFDHRTVLLVTLPLCLALLSAALLLSSAVAFVGSFVLLFAALGATDLFMNAEASVVEHELQRPVFTTFHAAATLAMAVAAISSSLLSARFGPAAALLPAAAGLSLAILAVWKGLQGRPILTQAEGGGPAALPRRILVFVGLAAGLNVACEVAAIQWAGQLLTSIAPELSAISGLGVAFYGLCGGVLRLFADGLRARHGDLKLMVVCVLFAIAGFLLLGLAPGFGWSVAAFAAVGMGLAVVFPCLFSFAARLVPEGRAAAMGFVAAVGGVPRVIIPWVLGLLAQHFGLASVFTACGIAAAGTLLIIVATFRTAQHRVPG